MGLPSFNARQIRKGQSMKKIMVVAVVTVSVLALGFFNLDMLVLLYLSGQ